MAKGVKFPDIVRHENPAYPIVDSNDVRGLNIYAVNFSDVDLSEISGPRRTVGHILSCTNAMYQYVGEDTSDGKWNNKDNWRCVQTSTEGGFSYIKVVNTTTEVKNGYGSGDSFIACSETQGIYKYVSDATPYINEYGDDGNKILETREGGNTRYVDIHIILNSSDYYLLKRNNLSDIDDRQAAIDNLCIDETVESGQFLYYDGNHMSFKSLPDIMTIKGRVDTVEELYELTEVSVGDVYFVGDEEYADDLEEYVCVSTDGSSPEWESLGKKAPVIQSDWEEDDATSPAHVLNKPAIRKGAAGNSTLENSSINNVDRIPSFNIKWNNNMFRASSTVPMNVDLYTTQDGSGTAYKVTKIDYDSSNPMYRFIFTFNTNPPTNTTRLYFVQKNGEGSHAENRAEAIGQYSHAENQGKSSGSYSHAEGNCNADGNYSHAEGNSSYAIGYASHAEGSASKTLGAQSHAEGYFSEAIGAQSHAEGNYTTATHASQHVFGEYNVLDPSSAASTARGTYVEIVGNGAGDSTRSNARTLDWQGNETIAGNLTVNGTTLTVNGQQIEPQVQADWTQATSTAKDYIKNKPTKTSDFTNDGSDGTSTYVESDELATVATTGSYSNLSDTPTNLSDFNNDEGFIDNTVNNLTNYYNKSDIDGMISARLKIQVVDVLPTEDIDTSTIYLVPISGSSSEDNVYEEYIYIIDEESSQIVGHWEMIGTAQVDLTDYMQKSNNLNDVDNKQAALNNLTGASVSQAGKYLKVDNNGNITFGNVDPQSQADWNQTDSTAVDYIKNKPTIPTHTSDLINDGEGGSSSSFVASDELATVATSGNFSDLQGATSSDEGKILSVNSQGEFNLIDRFETGAGMVANEVSIHDHRTNVTSKEYVPLMKLYHRNSMHKLQIEFSVVSTDGSSPRFYGRYMFIRSTSYDPNGKLYTLDFFSENKSDFDYNDIVAVNETVPSGVAPVEGQYYTCTTIYRKNMPSTNPNWAAYCIHSMSTYTYDGERGYVVPVFYVGNEATFLKDGEVRLTDNDAKYYSDFTTVFPCEDSTSIEIDEPLASQEIDDILI